MNTNIYAGNRIVLLPKFDAKATLEAMEREKVNFWVGVPTMFWALLKYVEETGFDVSKIRANMKVPTSGGAPMPVATATAAPPLSVSSSGSILQPFCSLHAHAVSPTFSLVITTSSSISTDLPSAPSTYFSINSMK
jgi:acyl-CoA synthetase (AMP-forming)/AMP-acid ligase II